MVDRGAHCQHIRAAGPLIGRERHSAENPPQPGTKTYSASFASHHEVAVQSGASLEGLQKYGCEVGGSGCAQGMATLCAASPSTAVEQKEE